MTPSSPHRKLSIGDKSKRNAVAPMSLEDQLSNIGDDYTDLNNRDNPINPLEENQNNLNNGNLNNIR